MAILRLALVGCLVALNGCGYALVGRGTVVDPDIKKIGVPVFKNTTAKAGLEQRITQAIIDELHKRGRFEILTDAAGANALVEGTLTAYPPARPVGFSEAAGIVPVADVSTSQATRYEISLIASVRYVKVGQPEPIWANESFSARDEYDLGTEAGNFLDREEQALDRLAERFARDLVAQMLEAF
jgi:hypothetical protein